MTSQLSKQWNIMNKFSIELKKIQEQVRKSLELSQKEIMKHISSEI